MLTASWQKKKELARPKRKELARLKKRELARVKRTRATLQRQLSKQAAEDNWQQEKLVTATT